MSRNEWAMKFDDLKQDLIAERKAVSQLKSQLKDDETNLRDQ